MSSQAVMSGEHTIKNPGLCPVKGHSGPFRRIGARDHLSSLPLQYRDLATMPNADSSSSVSSPLYSAYRPLNRAESQ